MKKLLIFMVSILVIAGCTKMDPIEAQDELNVLKGAKASKVDVCHYDEEEGTWQVINISMNAWPAHAAHGDVLLVDADGDGYIAWSECNPDGDCDDDNPDVYPGAEEICGDGIDNNCNGEVDEGCYSIFNVELDPASPASLGLGVHLNIEWDYTKADGDVLMFARPMKDGLLVPGYAAHASPYYTDNAGHATGYFFFDSEAEVDQIRIRIQTNTPYVVYYEKFVDVEYSWVE